MNWQDLQAVSMATLVLTKTPKTSQTNMHLKKYQRNSTCVWLYVKEMFITGFLHNIRAGINHFQTSGHNPGPEGVDSYQW